MLFDSFEFAFFLAVLLPLYFVLPRRGQNVLLLLASYFFYGFWDWRFLSLLWISTVVDYVCGRCLDASSGARRRKAILTISMVTNLGLLGFFKYFGFFVESFRTVLETAGFHPNPMALNLVLPVGISFYTFQTMSYTIDVYRHRIPAERNALNFALYVSFFPQLVAGPIERAGHLLPQMSRNRVVTWDRVSTGSWLIFWGLYKKIFVADNLAALVDPVYGDPGSASGFAIVVATYAFAFQIYADFSGYTDIARGVAKILGFDLMLNFKLPYFAIDPSDFWKRWHISLSEWLRDYLYIPLGGGRRSKAFVYRNLMLTMALGGLWHGASWNFVVWGVYHGLLLIAFRTFSTGRGTEEDSGMPARLFRMFCMFHLTCLGWVFFRLERIGDLGPMLEAFFLRFRPLPSDIDTMESAISFVALLIAMQVLQYKKNNLLAIFELPFWLRAIVYITIYFSMTLGGAFVGRAFIYFQF